MKDNYSMKNNKGRMDSMNSNTKMSSMKKNSMGLGIMRASRTLGSTIKVSSMKLIISIMNNIRSITRREENSRMRFSIMRNSNCMNSSSLMNSIMNILKKFSIWKDKGKVGIMSNSMSNNSMWKVMKVSIIRVISIKISSNSMKGSMKNNSIIKMDSMRRASNTKDNNTKDNNTKDNIMSKVTNHTNKEFMSKSTSKLSTSNPTNTIINSPSNHNPSNNPHPAPTSTKVGKSTESNHLAKPKFLITKLSKLNLSSIMKKVIS
jgi:hypothetical protein